VDWFDIWILGSLLPLNGSIAYLLILLTTLLRLGFRYLGQLYSHACQSTGIPATPTDFEQLQALSLSYFREDTSNLVNSLTTEVNQIAFNVVSIYITKGSTLLAYLITMFLLSWQLTIISFMLFSLLSVGISTLLAQVREASFEKSKATGLLSGTGIHQWHSHSTVTQGAQTLFLTQI